MPNGRRVRVAAGALAAAVLLVCATSRAADEAGQFAIRGAGLINCTLYSQERAAGSDVYLITAAWVDGYITGINQHASETYDLVPFETTELLMVLLDDHCKSNPQDPVFAVLTNLFEKLWSDRLTDKSDKTSIAMGEREARHYQKFIERVQQRLLAEGFYAGPISGEYSSATADAMKRYQVSVGLNTTGFPDQLSLWRLMRSEPGTDR